MANILCSLDLNTLLKQTFIDSLETPVTFVNMDEITQDMLEEVEVIIGNVPVHLANQAPQLKWLQLESAGADRYVTTLNPQVTLTNAKGAFGPAIAEYVIAGIFHFYKKFHQYQPQSSAAIWHRLAPMETLQGKRLCIVGYGDIGQQIALRAKVFGAHIDAITRVSTSAPYSDKIYHMNELDIVLATADIIILALPNTPETFQIINESTLRKCKKNALLINVGRGATLDSDALLRVLNEDYFQGVLLDVVHEEPLNSNHPLWKNERVMITPHCSGNYKNGSTEHLVLKIISDNINNYIHHRPLINIVQRELGY